MENPSEIEMDENWGVPLFYETSKLVQHVRCERQKTSESEVIGTNIRKEQWFGPQTVDQH